MLETRVIIILAPRFGNEVGTPAFDTCLSVVRTAASAGLLLHVLLSSPVIVE